MAVEVDLIVDREDFLSRTKYYLDTLHQSEIVKRIKIFHEGKFAACVRLPEPTCGES